MVLCTFQQCFSDIELMDGRLTCNFMFFFNSISVISGQWEGDNERLRAMEPHLQLERFPTAGGLEPKIANLTF